MTTLHLVSHTHWDREWYLTFQQFRLKLVHMIDNLLNILANEPQYLHFTLDGQTIILEDYLLMRPEQEAELRAYIQNGRILIGPWYILPDEFLVSPEATIRNLLEGDKVARRFGPKMNVGYIPDSFGHIGQMPQILHGFGIDTACVQRGLSDEPCEFWWQSPDGTRVFMANLRDGYGSADALTTSKIQDFISQIRELRDSLSPFSSVSHLLLMNGMDHREPSGEIPAAIACANDRLQELDQIIHSTLPGYLTAVLAEIINREITIPTITGELRSPKRHHLLPGVLSTRIWIKQRNHKCETLLEKWAEPFSTWATILKYTTLDTKQGFSQYSEHIKNTQIANPSHILRQTWRLLMECHPHDSICGCAIDQVHDEMRPRFDQVEQVGEEITMQSLEVLGAAANTRTPASEGLNSQTALPNADAAVVVFNPIAGPRTGFVSIEIELPVGVDKFEILDGSGKLLTHRLCGQESREIINMELDKESLRTALRMVRNGKLAGMSFRELHSRQEADQVWLDVWLSETEQPEAKPWHQALATVESYLESPEIHTFYVHARTTAAICAEFIAEEVPGFGYKTYWIRYLPATENEGKKPVKLNQWMRLMLPLVEMAARLPLVKSKTEQKSTASSSPPYIIENQDFRVEASTEDGTLTLLDKRSKVKYPGLNRFLDGGDCGDEYNYCPPLKDKLISAKLVNVQVVKSKVDQSIQVQLIMNCPRRLEENRQGRSAQKDKIDILTTATLVPGVPRLDIKTQITNPVMDHRLRVHFPAPFKAPAADYDGHFEIVRRATNLPAYDDTWAEMPRPEKPQRAFASISDEKNGLAIANRGLPEVEVLNNSNGVSEIALTLLRSIGWLSRDDFPTRKGHAGPMIATPGAQMIGSWAFEYAVIPYVVQEQSTNANKSFPFELAYAFNTPMRAIQTNLHSGILPGQASLIQIEPVDFVISAIKPSEDGSGWIVRGYNIISSPLTLKIRTVIPSIRAERVNLAELFEETIDPSPDGSFSLQVKAHQIATIKFIPGTG
jgi:mannosylglycerate hydrolase